MDEQKMDGSEATQELVRLCWPKLYGEVSELVGDLLSAAHARLSRPDKLIYLGLLEIAEEAERLAPIVERADEASGPSPERIRVWKLNLAEFAIRAAFVTKTDTEMRALYEIGQGFAELLAPHLPPAEPWQVRAIG